MGGLTKQHTRGKHVRSDWDQAFRRPRALTDILPDKVPISTFDPLLLCHHDGRRKDSDSLLYHLRRHRDLHIRASLRTLDHRSPFKQVVRRPSVVWHRLRRRERVTPGLDHVRVYVVSGHRPSRKS